MKTPLLLALGSVLALLTPRAGAAQPIRIADLEPQGRPLLIDETGIFPISEDRAVVAVRARDEGQFWMPLLSEVGPQAPLRPVGEELLGASLGHFGGYAYGLGTGFRGAPLWRSDGDSVEVLSPEAVEVQSLLRVAGRAFLVGMAEEVGLRVISPAGTITPVAGPQRPLGPPAAYETEVVFSGGGRLWRSDGTSEGTRSFGYDGLILRPEGLAVFEDRVIAWGERNRRLQLLSLRPDGSAPEVLLDLSKQETPGPIYVRGGSAWLLAPTSTTDEDLLQLVSTDGTAEGTVLHPHVGERLEIFDVLEDRVLLASDIALTVLNRGEMVARRASPAEKRIQFAEFHGGRVIYGLGSSRWVEVYRLEDEAPDRLIRGGAANYAVWGGDDFFWVVGRAELTRWDPATETTTRVRSWARTEEAGSSRPNFLHSKSGFTLLQASVEAESRSFSRQSGVFVTDGVGFRQLPDSSVFGATDFGGRLYWLGFDVGINLWGYDPAEGRARLLRAFASQDEFRAGGRLIPLARGMLVEVFAATFAYFLSDGTPAGTRDLRALSVESRYLAYRPYGSVLFTTKDELLVFDGTIDVAYREPRPYSVEAAVSDGATFVMCGRLAEGEPLRIFALGQQEAPFEVGVAFDRCSPQGGRDGKASFRLRTGEAERVAVVEARFGSVDVGPVLPPPAAGAPPPCGGAEVPPLNNVVGEVLAVRCMGSQALYSVQTAAEREALWLTDGTEIGTHKVADLPSLSSRRPRAQRALRVGDRLLFASEDEAGEEPWAVAIPACRLACCDNSDCGAFEVCSGGTCRLRSVERPLEAVLPRPRDDGCRCRGHGASPAGLCLLVGLLAWTGRRRSGRRP